MGLTSDAYFARLKEEREKRETGAPLSDEQLDAVHGYTSAATSKAAVLAIVVVDGKRVELRPVEGGDEVWERWYKSAKADENEWTAWRASPLAVALARRVEELERQWQRLEEREAACCPEDLPFDDYIRFLEQRIGRDAPLRDFLTEHYSQWRDDLQPWALSVIKVLRESLKGRET